MYFDQYWLTIENDEVPRKIPGFDAEVKSVKSVICACCQTDILAPRLGVLHLSSNGLVRPTQA